MPNLEDPTALIGSPHDRPAPTGFGFVGRHWQPRLQHAGTYDQAWQSERCPFLPLDFDERYFNSAPPDLVYPGYLKGGEPVSIDGVMRSGPLSFVLPQRHIEVVMRHRSKLSQHLPPLDTVVIEPDERRLTMLWRINMPCARSLLYIDYVRVREVA